MTKAMQILFNLLLGTIVCVVLIGTLRPSIGTPASSTPASSMPASTVSIRPLDAQLLNPSSIYQLEKSPSVINQHLMADLQESEAILMAQGATNRTIGRYAAILLNTNVASTMPSSTAATGVAGAALAGDRLVIRGDFGNLSSGLRDYATDPVNPPNPKITSAVHVHKGMPTENGPFQYALTVSVDATGVKGRFAGEYTLTSEQLQALADGTLYVDIHTKQNRAGELRGIFRQL